MTFELEEDCESTRSRVLTTGGGRNAQLWKM
jgi:hypothetical protein